MIKVYDLNMQLVAYLEHATRIGYEVPFNGLWTAHFTLPADDPKNAECTALRFVELYDGDERIDLFRIIPNSTQRDSSGQTITYQCEHVLATLLDDVLFQYHQIGGAGIYTANVLQYILSKQETTRWQLGTVQFNRQFEYKFENDNLLGALYSVPQPFVEAFQWTWDTSIYPWTLFLAEASTEPEAYIRYGLNLTGIRKDEDPTDLCTRLYCLGYGEGVNQLTISAINGGKPYLDADTQGQYGVVSRIFTDRRFESQELLKARGEVLLNELKIPRLTYTVSAADISQITNEPIHKFKSGAMVRVIDDELGIDITTRVVNVRKPDLTSTPWDAQIELANRVRDIASSIADLANRQRINEVYSQGATNLDSHDFADNADPEHPAVLRLYIPEETARINKVLLSYRCEAFRAYSKAIEGGGAVQKSTEAGGATIVSSDSESYDDTVVWDTGGMIGSPTTDFDGDHSHTISIASDGDHYHIVANGQTDTDGAHTHPFSSVESVAGHVHIMTDHKHYNRLIEHSHVVTLPNHIHEMIIPNHVHGIQYGIYEGPTPNAITVTVDGNPVTGLGTNESNVDLINYLSKDSSGRINRGWHEIEITPDSLGRVVASVNTQIFVQSRGGGNY